jgi:hypothetical protein
VGNHARFVPSSCECCEMGERNGARRAADVEGIMDGECARVERLFASADTRPAARAAGSAAVGRRRTAAQPCTSLCLHLGSRNSDALPDWQPDRLDGRVVRRSAAASAARSPARILITVKSSCWQPAVARFETSLDVMSRFQFDMLASVSIPRISQRGTEIGSGKSLMSFTLTTRFLLPAPPSRFWMRHAARRRQPNTKKRCPPRPDG